jgi:hypothetical protein
MQQSPFLNRFSPPSADEVCIALGSRPPLWDRLARFARETCEATGSWSTWGPAGTGWSLRFRRGSRAIVSLHPMREHTLAVVVLGKAQAEEALQLDLSDDIRRRLRESPQLRDGRWLCIPVRDASTAADVEALLLTKLSTRRRTSRKGG